MQRQHLRNIVKSTDDEILAQPTLMRAVSKSYEAVKLRLHRGEILRSWEIKVYYTLRSFDRLAKKTVGAVLCLPSRRNPRMTTRSDPQNCA